MNFFEDRMYVVNPKVLIRENREGDFHFRQDSLKGTYFRVFPSTAKEIIFLQRIRKNIEVYLPADEEGGLIVPPHLLPE